MQYPYRKIFVSSLLLFYWLEFNETLWDTKRRCAYSRLVPGQILITQIYGPWLVMKYAYISLAFPDFMALLLP
jgi:hypothetical protein